MPETLTAADLALIRDEIGTGDPADTDLRKSYAALGHWMPVAIRVLKRRRAAASAGGDVSQVSIPGAVGVTLGKADLAALDRQIAALEARYEALTGQDVGDLSFTISHTYRRVPR